MSTSSETTQQTPGADIEARLEALSREYFSLNAAYQPIAERMDQIKAEYRALLDYGSYSYAGGTIRIDHNPQFDKTRFMAAYPPERYGYLYKQVPDTKAISENLVPAEVRSYHNEGTPKVSVK
jgi:hypothetical protein